MRIDHITSSGYSQERGEFTVKYADGTDAYIVGAGSPGDVNFGIGTATPSLALEVVGAISGSGKITGLTGSFSELEVSNDISGSAITTGSFGSIVLTAPNGTGYLLTINNSGHLSITGSAV